MHTQACIQRTQSLDVQRATLVQHLGPLIGGHERQGLGHHVIQPLGPEAAAQHQQPERASAACKALRGRRLLQKFGP